jgi:gamma-glutamyltranspeptidase/glutathione hydrolase
MIGGLTPISDFGPVQVLVTIIDLGMGLQQVIDAPRCRYMNGRDVLLENEIPAAVIDRLLALGHVRAPPPGLLRSSMGGGQAVMIDPVNGTLMGASDPRKDGLAIVY